eukprot:TRINITY_DN43566_c0_g1_i1.p1 TRINITY_DN43566_c0_g1~~TRINITY_DN43566_c0_g1_i1.p1  ORF type:complete len:730 (-),score=101.67 TRINITY_DN43566_c0_g1_i1:84-2231(-)
MGRKKQMQRKTVEAGMDVHNISVSVTQSHTSCENAAEAADDGVGNVDEQSVVARKKGKKKQTVVTKEVVETDASVSAGSAVHTVTNTKQKGKNKSRITKEIAAVTQVANATASAGSQKKNKRKVDAVEATGAEEQRTLEIQNVQDVPAPRKKLKKCNVQKAARQLVLELGAVQTRLQEVRTHSQFEEALSALRSLQVADIGIQDDMQDQKIGLKQIEHISNSTAPATQNSTSVVEASVHKKAENSIKLQGGAVKYNFADWPTVSDKKALKRRTTLSIEIEDGDSVPPPVLAFSELQVLPHWVSKALEENNWSKPTSIQAQALPILLSGRSLVGVAQTGSGKTGAFLLPAIVHVDAQAQLTKRSPGPVVLILAPTRELAVQIGEEADKLLKYSTQSANHPQGIFSTCFYGGGRKQDQLWRFTSSGRHLVVATPGRLADCVASSEVSMSRVTYLVLDEADRMLDDGFSGEVGQILSGVRTERQVALFSATWPASVQELAKAVMPGQCAPVRIRVGGSSKAAEEGALQARKGITQEVVVIDYPSSDWKKAAEKKNQLMEAHVRKVLTSVADSKVLVFVNTKALADDLSTKLWKEGFHADSMHGGRPQETRLTVLRKFREGQLRLLVVTDVFARGLDIPQVSHVVIYEMGETEDYIHRIGRTGRGVGGTGHALVFFEYWPGYPAGAEELIGVLERSEQKVPQGLRRIAAEVLAGTRPTR